MKVQDAGPLDASIMLVGESPGVDEERCGEPFVGCSGKLLRAMLKHCGVNFSSCYVTNVMNERPPGNRFSYFYDAQNIPSKALEESRSVLRAKIERIKPKVVILLGNEALKAVMNLNGIMTWRGCFLSYRGIKIMPTYHPSAVIRSYELHPIFEMDVIKATTKEPAEWPETIVAPSLSDVVSVFHEAQKVSMVSFDIETVGKDVRSLAIAFRCSNGKTKSISVPFIKFASSQCGQVVGSIIKCSSDSLSSYWPVEDELIVLQELQQLFDSDVLWIGQNSFGFDEPLILRSFRMRPKNHVYDLMHMFHLLYCEFPKSLNFICSALTCYPNYWTKKDTLIDLDEWTYNARDTICTLEACEVVLKELKETKLLPFYEKHLVPLSRTLIRLENKGVLINKTIMAEHLTCQEARKKQAQENLNKLAGHTVNANSPKQIKQLLFSELKYPTAISPQTKKVTTDEEVIRKLAQMYPKEQVFQEIITYRKASKLIGTYLTLQTSENGRLHSSYNPSGTKTGRLSSSKNLFNEGTNLQNIPAGKGLDIVNLRDMFVAPPGKLLLKADLKQAETMVVGEILLRLKFPQMHDLYQQEGFDVHTWAASFTFKKKPEDVLKRERDVAKIRNHSGNYMAGPNVMVKTALKYGVDIDYHMAKRLLTDHKTQVSGIEHWWGWVEKQLKKTRTLYNCFGRRRVFFGRIDQSTIREAVAWEPQSTVGDLTNRILTTLDKTLPEGAFPVLQVHDEVVAEIPEDKLDECVECFKKAAIIPLAVCPTSTLIIPLEIEVGHDWKNMKEVK